MEIFEKYDKNNDGALGKEEVMEMVKEMRLKKRDTELKEANLELFVTNMIDRAGKNRSGAIISRFPID
jgi:Ca2+-binding EF-hand superfamily protein